jgi:subtilisin family serine protease
LLQFVGDLASIEAAGFRTRSVAGDVATGEVDLAKLSTIEANPNVVRLEASRVLHRDLNLALPEIRANAVHVGPPGNRGTGVIVGLIDSGIDYQHAAFRRNDGTTRILAIWDQGLAPGPGERNPTGFAYGVEYDQADVNAALAAANPLTVVRHQDLPQAAFHGTHVAGIAAGDGSAPGQGQPANTFIGVAPEADIVVVANTRGRAANERGLGDSADTLDAVRYIFDVAARLRRPVVINQSQGDNVGPHDGTSILERGIDNLLGGPGRAMVKSAGNEGNLNCHASGTVLPGAANTPSFNMPANRVTPVTIDVWYGAADRFAFSVTPPGGVASAVVNPANTTTINLPNGNRLFVDSDLNDPGNGDNRIFIVIEPGTQPTVQAGTWTITLQGTTVVGGQWDAWIQRGGAIQTRPQFLAPFVNPARTISIPGTGRQMITAAAYVTNAAGVGSRSTFSSLGPTRDGRQAPTIAAPGEDIMAPQPAATGDPYGLKAGTSMASPMVAGTIALLLERNPGLTQPQIRDCLTNTARSDGFTGTVPNNAWGAGKLDTLAAFQCAAPPRLTIRPPCVVRTIQPPCVVQTVRPPCVVRTLNPPCVIVTVRPPCVFDTIRPPCVVDTVRPPCVVDTIRPPCVVNTLAPPCPQPTLGPGCLRPTLGPACGQPVGPIIGPIVTPLRDVAAPAGWPAAPGWGAPSAGWVDPTAGEQAAWGYGPAGWSPGPELDWSSGAYQAAWPASPYQGYDPSAAAAAAGWAQSDWDVEVAAAENDAGEGYPDAMYWWYGNRGY